MQQGLVEIGWTFFFVIVNFVIFYLLMKKYMFKRVTDHMDNRTKDIADSFELAASKKKDAEVLIAEYQSKIEDIRDERNAMIKDATTRAELRAKEITNVAKEEAKKIMAKAQADIEREKIKTTNIIKDQMSVLAIGIASKVIEKELDQAAHQKMIHKIINEVGETSWQN
ncbi:F0F1 ATP synthase subunit B [bacterium AH-315-E09]|nr:F0F1 ATP synthase subunit B [bacterium AH-315-L21]MBN4062582.1 F0F1 ATP synthase subunit B [Alkaliphilus sp. AH-315-G20]MBN4074586.1 F0F1 ATP synthase subunit B [bacterium AH-315-E09]